MISFEKQLLLFSITTLCIFIVFTSCQKQMDAASNDTGARQLSVYLTDYPCKYDSVFIDIKYAEVKLDAT